MTEQNTSGAVVALPSIGDSAVLAEILMYTGRDAIAVMLNEQGDPNDFSRIVFGVASIFMGPVSYTHLDVYKRQAEHLDEALLVDCGAASSEAPAEEQVLANGEVRKEPVGLEDEADAARFDGKVDARIVRSEDAAVDADRARCGLHEIRDAAGERRLAAARGAEHGREAVAGQIAVRLERETRKTRREVKGDHGQSRSLFAMGIATVSYTHLLAQAGCSGCRKAAGRCGICGFAVRRGP